MEPPRSHHGYAAAKAAGVAARQRADEIQAQWLSNLPSLPIDKTWDKASKLHDPTNPVFWSGSLHTPAVRCFMTPTVVHRTRANALRKTMFSVRTQLYDCDPREHSRPPSRDPLMR